LPGVEQHAHRRGRVAQRGGEREVGEDVPDGSVRESKRAHEGLLDRMVDGEKFSARIGFFYPSPDVFLVLFDKFSFDD
jgi:hypothetical protein